MRKRFIGGARLFKIICGIVAAVFIAAVLPPICLAESTGDYAMAVFGKDATEFYNMTERVGPESMAARDVIDGKECIVGSEVGNTPDKRGLFFQFTVDKNVMYNLPNGTPIEVTVEYYDGVGGSFVIDYDSYNSTGDYPNLNSTETVYRTGTNRWKTHTFYIDDHRMSKENNTIKTDFRLGMYGVKMGMSSGGVLDIAFASVKVEYADFKQILNSEIKTDKIGNIFDADENVRIKHSLKNKSEKNVTATLDYKLYDSNEYIKEEHFERAEFSAKQEKTTELELNNMNKFDIYRLECILTEWYSDNPNDKRIHTYTAAITRAMLPQSGNPDFGACQQIANGRGEAENVGASMKSAGLTILRDDVVWERFDTEAERAKNLPILKNRITTLKNNGVDYLALLWNNSKKPMSDGGNVPSTSDELIEWEEYCRTMARELKGYTDYFEIWNEYNLSLFNTTSQPPETYVELLKRAYGAIKAENPNAVIIGATPSEIDLTFLENIFKLGALDYMDAVGIHPYDWSGQFRESRYVNKMKSAQELMDKYGRRLPIWNTELGFGTCLSDSRYGHTRFEQCAAIVRAWILNKANGLADKWIYYMYTDMDNPTVGESCFGIVNGWANDELTDYGAKESFLAVSAMNSLIGADSEVINSFEDYTAREYAVNFYNSRLGKNVLVAESYNCTANMSFYLGCDSVDVYDMYGNKTATVSSDDGAYSFYVGLKPKYIVGKFSDNIIQYGKRESFYEWASNTNAENVWRDGLGISGGTYGRASDIEFDETEGALTLNNDGVKDGGKYDFFNYDIGRKVQEGKLDISFKFKTNGAYFGIILDSGSGSADSTYALTVTPWGTWNEGDGRWSGVIGHGKFPWNPTMLRQSYDVGHRLDNKFGMWWTVEISTDTSNKKYDLVLKTEDGEVYVSESGLDMAAAHLNGIVFAQFDDMDWNAVTYVKDISIEYETDAKPYANVQITKVLNKSGNKIYSAADADGKITVNSLVQNTAQTEVSYSVIAAAYNRFEQLSEIQIGESHTATEDKTFSDEFNFSDISDVKRIQFFVWDKKMIPYAESFIVTDKTNDIKN